MMTFWRFSQKEFIAQFTIFIQIFYSDYVVFFHILLRVVCGLLPPP